MGESQFQRLEKHLALCLLCAAPAPDPALFVIDLKDANKKYFLFFCLLRVRYLVCEVTFNHSLKKKSHKEGTFLLFLLDKEGSGRPKKLRIWIRNTVINPIQRPLHGDFDPQNVTLKSKISYPKLRLTLYLDRFIPHPTTSCLIYTELQKTIQFVTF